MCERVCVCMYVCVSMYVCMCVSIYVYIHTYMCIFMYVLYAYIHTYIHTYINTYIHTCITQPGRHARKFPGNKIDQVRPFSTSKSSHKCRICVTPGRNTKTGLSRKKYSGQSREYYSGIWNRCAATRKFAGGYFGRGNRATGKERCQAVR